MDLTRAPIQQWLRRHPRALDVAAALLFVVINPALLDLSTPRELTALSVRSTVAVLILSLVGAALVPWRRRHPRVVGVLWVGLAAGIWPLAQQWPLAMLGVAGYSVGVALRAQWAGWWLAAEAALTFGVSVWVNPVLADGSSVEMAPWLVGQIVTIAAWALGVVIARNRLFEQEILRRTEEFATLRAEVAVDRERRRIAAELHDVVSHSLTVMVNLADGAFAARDRAPEQAWSAVGASAETGRAAMADMTSLLDVLGADRSPATPTPAHPTPDAVVARVVATGLPVDYRRAGPEPRDPELALAVRRAVQEGLTNVLKHAPEARRTRVEVESSPTSVRIRVTNDLPTGPATPASDSGYGLLGLTDRVERLGGSLSAGESPEGWELLVMIPADPNRGSPGTP